MRAEIKKKYEKFNYQWAKIVSKAWNDPAFKQKLLKNPVQVLKEEGVEIPEGVTFSIHENSNKIVHLSLPLKPEGEISDEELKVIVAGAPAYRESPMEPRRSL